MKLGSSLAALFLSLLLVLQATGAFDDFDSRRHDRLLQLGSLPPIEEPIFVVRIDDATLQARPQPLLLWSPFFAEAVDAAVEAGAALVALDFLFVSLAGDSFPELGYPLVSALGRARSSGIPVIVAAVERDSPEDSGVVLQLAHPLIRAGSSGVGLANVTFDGDGVVRRQELTCSAPFPFASAIAGALDSSAGQPDPSCTRSFLPIRFRDTAGAWPGVSLEELLRRKQAGEDAWLRETLGGRIVLLGSTAADLGDRVVTPLVPRDGQLTPGVEVHAHTLHTLLSGDAHRTLPLPAVLLLLAGLGLLSFLGGSRLSPRAAVLAGLVACAAWGAAVLSLRGLEPPVLAPLAGPLLALLFPGASAALGRFQEEQRARKQLARSLGAYVNEHVLRAVLQDPEAAGIHGASRRVTVLMADIVGYSGFAEARPPEEVVGVLNTYFEAMTEAIQREGGTVDKFIGDGLLAIFGAPLPLPRDGASHAVKAALEMERQLERLQAEWRLSGVPALDIGIGVHTGTSVVGNMGSTRKMEYTVIGDAVNVAARIESSSRGLGHRILISDDCFAQLEAPPPAEDLGEVALKGREGTVRLWGLSRREERAGANSPTPHP